MTELQGGSIAFKNGKDFESKVKQLLDDEGYSYIPNKKVYYLPNRYYRPDLIINDSYCVELKCQHVGGSAKNKLSQAVAELSFISAERGYIPILVYTGKQLTDFVKVDPAFNKIRSIFHHVLVMDADQFIDYIKSGKLETTNAYRFTNTHINNGYQN